VLQRSRTAHAAWEVTFYQPPHDIKHHQPGLGNGDSDNREWVEVDGGKFGGA
jgi:hypothetical protein